VNHNCELIAMALEDALSAANTSVDDPIDGKETVR
jgi:hypothetical protein